MIIARKDGVCASSLDDETILFDKPKGHYFGLNDVGTFIWDRLEKPALFSELIDALTVHYQVETLKCIDETAEFIRKLEKQGMIQIKE